MCNCGRGGKKIPRSEGCGNAKTFNMMKQFFTFDVDAHAVVIKTYDAYDKVLFSADAFGTFGALNGNVFADEVNFKEEWLDDARRYLVNIVGKYGGPVQSALKKALTLDIAMICPLHGPIWRENLGWFIDKYQKWSTYTPEDHNVVVMYASIYGNTENAADVLAGRLADAGEKNVKVYDVSVTDPSYLVAEAFRCDRIVFACPSTGSTSSLGGAGVEGTDGDGNKVVTFGTYNAGLSRRWKPCFMNLLPTICRREKWQFWKTVPGLLLQVSR